MIELWMPSITMLKLWLLHRLRPKDTHLELQYKNSPQKNRHAKPVRNLWVAKNNMTSKVVDPDPYLERDRIRFNILKRGRIRFRSAIQIQNLFRIIVESTFFFNSAIIKF